MVNLDARFNEAEAMLVARIRSVALEPYTTLAALPPWDVQASTDAQASADVTVLRTTRPDRSLQIVVTAYRQRGTFLFLRFGLILAKGFVMAPSGEVTMLVESELYDYM